MLSAKLLSKTTSPVGADWHHYELGEGGALPKFVIVSAVVAMFTGPETYIFEADEQGKVTNWTELDGSFRGSLDHAQALRNAGYSAGEPS